MKKKNHYFVTDILPVITLIVQFVAFIVIGYFAYNIQAQNFEIQKTLYDFDPQISGFANGIIWVYQYKNDAVASIEVLINAPHSGNFTLQVNHFYLQEQYLDSERIGENHLELKSPIRDTTYPQGYRFRGDVALLARICPKQNLTELSFNAGVLEFEIVYWDIPRETLHTKLFNGTVWFESAQP